MGKKIQKEITLGVLESIVEKNAKFKQWGPFSDIEIMEWEGFVPNLDDASYVDQMRSRMEDRMDYVLSLDKDNEGYNRLPADAAAAIGKIVEQAKTL